VANRCGVLLAEIAVNTVLRTIKGEPLGDVLYSIDSATVSLRTRADYVALAQRFRPATEIMIAR
jgi:hypothetical protein